MLRLLAPAVLLAVLGRPGLAGAEVPVSVLELVYQGEVPAALRPLLKQRVAAGLGAAGLRVVVEPPARASSSCAAPACWKQLARQLGSRFLVEGEVAGEDRSYQIKLRLLDGHRGETVAVTEESCEICGQEALGQKLELAASGLRARLVASARAPARLQVITDPPGAAITVDGRPQGQAPRELELGPGTHQLTASAPGWITLQRRFDAVPGVQERLELRLIRSDPDPGRKLRLIGWNVGGVGVAMITTAAVLFAVHGRGLDCGSLPGAECPRRQDTQAAGWTLAGLGVAAVVTGTVLLIRGRRPR